MPSIRPEHEAGKRPGGEEAELDIAPASRRETAMPGRNGGRLRPGGIPINAVEGTGP